MKQMQEELSRYKLEIILKLGAGEIRKIRKTTQLLPDFDLVPYGGLDERQYPVELDFSLAREFQFVFRVRLADYGYLVDDTPDELWKYTSGTGNGDGENTGKLNLAIRHVDRFARKVFISGKLYGSSIEMSMDVAFDLLIAGHASQCSRLGYAAEAIAEAFAFENDGRLRQAFFGYFTAIDSFINSECEKLNRGLPADKQIADNDRLFDKLSRVVKAHLGGPVRGLNDIRFWGDLKHQFKELERLRNGIAHNVQNIAIDGSDVDSCFSLLAIVIALTDLCFDEKSVRENYGVGSL